MTNVEALGEEGRGAGGAVHGDGAAPRRIVVINPNSNERVTGDIDRAVEAFRFADGPRIDCVTLAEGPPGVESQRDVEAVALPLSRLIQELAPQSDAFVIACFSDPGLSLARETTERPVFGIAESGLLAALNFGTRIGIISILDRSIPRHLRYVRALGLEGRLAGDLAINVGVAGLADEDAVLHRMVQTGRRLIDERDADVLVMGCAGMARYREALEDTLGVPVIDPTQAAVAAAVMAVQTGCGGGMTR